jgi:fibronectin-binding autotransporter adhesin
MNISSSGNWADSLGDAGSSINNAGKFSSSGGTANAPCSISTALDSTNDLEVDAGALALQGGGAFEGILDIRRGSALLLRNGAFVAQALDQVTGQAQGAFIVNGDTSPALNFVIAASAAAGLPSVSLENIDLQGGTITGAGNLEIRRTLKWIGGTMDGAGSTVIDANAVLHVRGNVSGSRQIINNGWAGVENGKTLTMSGADFLNFGMFILVGSGSIVGTPTATFNNNVIRNNLGVIVTTGEIDKVRNGTSTFGIQLDNKGNLQVVAGGLTLTRGSSFRDTSQTFILAGATLTFFTPAGLAVTETFNAGAVVNAAGTVAVVNDVTLDIAADESIALATLTVASPPLDTFIMGGGALSAGSCSLVGCSLGGSIAFVVGQGQAMTIGAGCTMFGNATIANAGTVNLTSGFSMADSSSIVNTTGGVFSVQTMNRISVADPTVPMGVSAPTLKAVAGGTISVDAGGGGDIAPTVLNTGGNLYLNGRTLTLNKYTPDGGDTSLAGGSLTVNTGITQTGGTFYIDGGTLNTSKLVLAAGATLEGGGSITGDVISSGTITYGAGGILSINGDYTQLAGGTLQVALWTGEPSTVALQVGGNITLDGTLGVSQQGALAPNGGAIIMYGGALTGTFAQVQAIDNNNAWAADYGTASVIFVSA